MILLCASIDAELRLNIVYDRRKLRVSDVSRQLRLEKAVSLCTSPLVVIFGAFSFAVLECLKDMSGRMFHLVCGARRPFFQFFFLPECVM